MDSFEGTLDYLYNKLPMFQRIGPAAYKNSLENTQKLDILYRHPHRNFKTVHVAGTNGKGSVSHMIASVLQTAGYKTGLYTSPHLKDFRERIKVDGAMISREDVADWVEKFRKYNSQWKIEPSFFELTAAMAFDYFSQEDVDVAVIEVGLGGRLDSTNIITPEASIITNISYDHTALLGGTLEKIAAEKAGIIKKNIPVVIGQTQEETTPVFSARAQEMSAPLYFADSVFSAGYSMTGIDGKQIFNIRKGGELVYPELKIDLAGLYQQKNICPVLKACEILAEKGFLISKEQIYEGLSSVAEKTGLMGRWQILGHNPLIVCDTGHNEDGIKSVLEQVKQTPHKKLHFIYGAVNDKDISKILQMLPKDAQYYFTRARIPRALDEHLLSKEAESFGLKGKAFPSVSEAFEAAKAAAGANDFILVSGSTFVVAEVL